MSSGATTTVWVAGPLPMVCLKCGAREGVQALRRRFAVVGDAGLAGDASDVAGAVSDVAGGLLQAVGFVRTLATTKEAELEVPLCGACAGRWARA